MDLSDLKVLYEDNHLIAVNKPAGWLVQGDETGDAPLSDYVKWYIKVRFKKPGDVFLGHIHRLDRPVSGVVLFARTSKALVRMNKAFKDREVKKTYLAITGNRPNPFNGTLVHYLLKDKTRNYVNASKKPFSKAKRSELHYKLKASIDTQHLLEINPITGRPHQIRVQLSQIGCPIRGDLKYGYTLPNEDGCISLHARSLSFIHPVKKEPVRIDAAIPDDPIWKKFKDFK